MNYDFATLSFTNFEALSPDLLGRELGIRLEAFATHEDSFDQQFGGSKSPLKVFCH